MAGNCYNDVMSTFLKGDIMKTKRDFYPKPDFYLLPVEAIPVVYPLKCWVENKFEYEQRDFFLIKASPPLIYSDSQQKISETEQVVLAARYEGKTIEKIRKWPLIVNIMKLNKELDSSTHILTKDDVEIIALGEIYPSVRAVWKIARKIFEKNDIYW